MDNDDEDYSVNFDIGHVDLPCTLHCKLTLTFTICFAFTGIFALMAFTGDLDSTVKGVFIVLGAIALVVATCALILFFCLVYDEQGEIRSKIPQLQFCVRFLPSICLRNVSREVSVSFRRRSRSSSQSRLTAQEGARQGARQAARQPAAQRQATPVHRLRGKLRDRALDLAKRVRGAEGCSSSLSSPLDADDTTAAVESLPTDSVAVMSPRHRSTFSDMSEMPSVSLSGIASFVSDENMDVDSSDQEVFYREEQAVGPRQITVGGESAGHGRSRHPSAARTIEKGGDRLKRKYNTERTKRTESKSEQFEKAEVGRSKSLGQARVGPSNDTGTAEASGERQGSHFAGHQDVSSPGSAENLESEEPRSRVSSVGESYAESSELSENVKVAESAGGKGGGGCQKESALPETPHQEKGEICSQSGSPSTTDVKNTNA